VLLNGVLVLGIQFIMGHVRGFCGKSFVSRTDWHLDVCHFLTAIKEFCEVNLSLAIDVPISACRHVSHYLLIYLYNREMQITS
jgi:hypothetical protein